MELKEVLVCIDAYIEQKELLDKKEKSDMYNVSSLISSWTAGLIGNMFKKSNYFKIPSFDKVFNIPKTQKEKIDERYSYYKNKAMLMKASREAK